MTDRSEALASRVAQGHQALITLIESLSEDDWHKPIPGDVRSVGVVLHHIADVLPVEMELVRSLADDNPISGVTLEAVNALNAQHAADHARCTKSETLALLKKNSTQAVAAIRDLSDAELDRACPVSLHWDAPLTTQFFIEAHPLSHSYQHAALIRAALSLEAVC